MVFHASHIISRFTCIGLHGSSVRKIFEDHFGSAGCWNKYWPFSNEKKRLSLLLFFLSRI